MPGTEVKWTDNAHLVLLCAALDIIGDGGKVSIATHKDKFMAALEANGYKFTWEGVRQHLQKLRRKEGGPGPAAGKDDGAGPSTPKSTPKTPGGRKKNVGAAAKSTPGSAKRKKSAATAESVDDSEPDTKKVKDEKTDVKQEIASEDEGCA